MKITKSGINRKLDKIVSEIVRSQGRCVRCGKVENLQCCHIFSRANRAVRWDLDNLLCMCAGCHFWSHANPTLFAEFVKTHLGDKYNTLKDHAKAIRKRALWELEELYLSFQKLKDKQWKG